MFSVLHGLSPLSGLGVSRECLRPRPRHAARCSGKAFSSVWEEPANKHLRGGCCKVMTSCSVFRILSPLSEATWLIDVSIE